MKIGVKLVTIISIFNIIGIGLLAGVTLTLSEREISRLAEEQATGIAREGGEKIGKWFEEYMGATRTLAYIMEGYQEIPVMERREYFNLMLKQVVIAHSEANDVWANWAPNALDGMDAEFANTPGTDESGRFISSWYLRGAPQLVAIISFDWDAVLSLNIATEYLLDPAEYIDPLTGRKDLTAIAIAPVRNKDEIVGYAGVTVKVLEIQAMVKAIKPFGDGHAMLFSNNGIVAAHSDPERLGKNMRETEADTFGPFLNTMVDAVTTGTAASFSYRPPQSDAVIQYYSVPFMIGHFPQPWTLVVGVSQNTVMAPVYRMIRLCLIIGVLTMLLMSAGVVFTARSISRPIAHTMTALKDIAEGDLTKEIAVSSQDEMGDLARYVNFTVEKIKGLALSIRKEADALSRTGDDLAANMEETATAVNEIAASIQSVKDQVGKQDGGVKSAGAIMEQIVDHICAINDQIQKQSECVSESSSCVEEMLENIQSVTQSLVKNESNVSKLSHASEVGRAGLAEVSTNIQEIARESAGLLEINAVMENIASQTNILSMNAAIEAAHAGESGKGFAVVAGEIRKLAESSGKQSKTISDVLKKIKDSIDKITKSTNEVLLHFEAISEGVQTVTDQESGVRKAMEEQGAGNKAILESIGSLNEITLEVKQSADRMLEGGCEVIEESRALEAITEEIGNGVAEMASGAEQINGAVNQVNGIAVENKERIAALMGEVSRFKVE
ncbi:MAG: methyl-accepting chemotaxis protein [Treponema sp.]|jgi:methyl-accepting chemotaxis protein|nr:methyl-accepting chemotaxis protein [Treponema sp.]